MPYRHHFKIKTNKVFAVQRMLWQPRSLQKEFATFPRVSNLHVSARPKLSQCHVGNEVIVNTREMVVRENLATVV